MVLGLFDESSPSAVDFFDKRSSPYSLEQLNVFVAYFYFLVVFWIA